MKNEDLSPGFVVGQYATVTDAEIVQGILADAGIESFINNPYMSNLYPSLSLITQVELQVRAEDAELAMKIIKADFVKE